MKIQHKSGSDTRDGNRMMLKNQAVEFKHHANELSNAVKKAKHVDAWVVAKAERATTDLSDITHYLDGQSGSYAKGGVTYVDARMKDDNYYRKYYTRYPNAIGSFQWKYKDSGNSKYYNYPEGILYALDDFDKEYYAHLVRGLRKGEYLLRYRTDRMPKDEKRLIKINLDKSLLYFMDSESMDKHDDKNIKFLTRGVEAMYIVVEYDKLFPALRYEHGGETSGEFSMSGMSDAEVITMANSIVDKEVGSDDSMKFSSGYAARRFLREYHSGRADVNEDEIVDYFSEQEGLSDEAKMIIAKYSGINHDEDSISEMRDELMAVGYEFDYDDDMIPYSLRRVGEEDDDDGMFADGGNTKDSYAESLSLQNILNVGDTLVNAVGKKLKVYAITPSEYVLMAFGGFPSPWRKDRIHELIKTGEWALDKVMASGGQIDADEIEKSAKFYADNPNWTVEKLEKEVKEHKALLKDWEAGYIKPSKVIGTGYKSSSVARKLADNWIRRQLAIFIKALELKQQMNQKEVFDSPAAPGSVGDSALVESENKLGTIVSIASGKYLLKFVDGTTKSYNASELKFIKDEDDYPDEETPSAVDSEQEAADARELLELFSEQEINDLIGGLEVLVELGDKNSEDELAKWRRIIALSAANVDAGKNIMRNPSDNISMIERISKMKLSKNVKTGEVFAGGVKSKNKIHKDGKGYYVIEAYFKFMKQDFPIKKYFKPDENDVITAFIEDKYASGGMMKKGGITGGYQDLTDMYMSQKIEMLLSKIRPYENYYIDQVSNKLYIYFTTEITNDESQYVMDLLTSSPEFFKAGTADTDYDSERDRAVVSVELNRKVEYGKGGTTFQDKVNAISGRLEGTQVPRRLRSDYGRRYNKEEAKKAAQRIAGAMRKKGY